VTEAFCVYLRLAGFDRPDQALYKEIPMTAKLIDGKQIAAEVRADVADRVAKLKAEHGVTPGLATVLVGEDPASAAYVRSKQRMCEKLGIHSVGHKLEATASQEEVEKLVADLNADPAIHGILVQLPLPKHLDEEAILNKVDLKKDVDGFHPINIGRLTMKGREPLFIPCTPHGCIYLLEASGIEISGAEAVVVGRSNIVGLPVAMLLQERNATVTICHSRTRDLASHLKRADIVIAAVGVTELVTGDMLKPGTAVIDVGINRKDDPATERGYRLVGDVDFESAKEVAGYITPVPGGVGPMTIAMLMLNTLRAAEMTVS
jgi:methylenetetrahydrofolate dehydrogenase (NADP+) / methenyltetrahydrofolate cyclohydrolase